MDMVSERSGSRDATASPPVEGQSTAGVFFAFASFAAFSFSDASVKLIDGALSPIESAFFGAVVGLAAVPFLMRRADRVSDMVRTSNRALWFLRFLASPVAVIGSVTAFTHLSMAEAFALIFLMPAFVTIMSVIFLKERVGIRRWSAVAVGFAGVLVILRPGFRELSVGHLGAVLAGLCGAVSVISFRAAGPTEKRISLFGAGALGAILVCGLAMVPSFRWPNAHEWMLLAGYGLLAALGNVLLMMAAMKAPATHIGPTQYSQMLWAILLGYLLFGNAIDGWVLTGIILIIGSGVLTLFRERQRGTPLPPPVSAGNNNAPLALASDDGDGPA